MGRCNKREQAEGTSVTVRVDVTKIVRYLCITGILVVGIIFGTKCYMELIKEQEE